MLVVITIYGNDLEFIDACLNFSLFFESVDVDDGSFSKGAVIWVEYVVDNLGDAVGVCNVGCCGGRENSVGERHVPCGTPLMRVKGGPVRW